MADSQREGEFKFKVSTMKNKNHIATLKVYRRAGTGPVEPGISPVVTFEKYLLTLFLAMKTKMSHIFW
jgi:hypothetical protein